MTSIIKVDQIQNAAGVGGLSIDGSGRINMPAQPKFHAYLASNYSLSSGADSSFGRNASWTERFDIGGCFSGGRFTAPVTGYWQLHAATYANPSSGTYIGLYWVGTGADTTYAFRYNGNDAGTALSSLLYIQSGQYVDLGAYGSTSHTLRSDGTFWWGMLVSTG